MLYNLLYPLSDQYSVLNIFKYLTFRTGGAIFTALIICFLIGPAIIHWLKDKQHACQPIREDGPESHLKTKQGTPTMGGLMILISVCLSTLLWADWKNVFVWVVLGITLSFSLIGFTDDYLKVSKKNSQGMRGKLKLLFEFLFAFIAVWFVTKATTEPTATTLGFPFFKNLSLNLSCFYIPFAMFVIVGSSNAVNLTDGLDGLAIMPAMIVSVVFLIISYVAGHAAFAAYLQISYIAGTGELAVFCGALIGAGLGFLWFNAPPAKIFMGDTGSLMLGGALGTLSVITKHEIVLAIAGGLFVLETFSVIIQVVSFKLTGHRVFKMAPIHHHFEKMGWSEQTVVVRFWIISIILGLIALSTLKIR
ncbi:MAG: phospho-N-acetylmuramoyl-pentapeptide-transferase [Alphaproteobacteria bacterium]|nr:phospho-N-acetylmuramoyl-pentapeptide-transferase [Alphaproteobacteria bacterium]